MNNIIDVKNVTKIFSKGIINKSFTRAVNNISLNIDSEKPMIRAIAGESGSGKTTLARMILGLISPTEGELFFQGQNINKLNNEDRLNFRKSVQPIFQDPFGVFNPFYKIDRVLNTPLIKFQVSNNKTEIKDRIETALNSVGLRPDETLGRYPHELSGGQRQRIMVARALILEPKVIVADEPVSMVDASLRATILESIYKFKEEQNISVIYITHDLTTAHQLCDDIMVLYAGNMVEAGPIDLIVRNPSHPYTKLLVNSIPFPDPDMNWKKYDPKDRLKLDVESVGWRNK
jgi:peptide/nickel transport system ATP-binding protein